MRILNLSLDKKILEKDSFPAHRIKKYGDLVDKYFVIIPASKNISFDLSLRVKIYGVRDKYKFFTLYLIFKKAWQIIKRNRVDIISVQDTYYLAILVFVLAHIFNIGLEVQVHGFEKFTFLREIVARFVLPRADSIRTVSHRLKKILEQEFGIREQKITVVPIYSQKPSKKELDLDFRKTKDNNKFVFLTIGRLVPVKNISMQIKALKNVIDISDKQIELWIVGDGPERVKLQNITKDFGIEKQVKFFGWQDNLDNFYRQADVFLLTSNSEGWGMVILEAASWGLPIIMTRVGCADEFIIHNKHGIIIPVGHQKELIEAMLNLMNNEDLRFKLGQAAFEAFKDLPSEEEVLNLYKESWRKALGSQLITHNS